MDGSYGSIIVRNINIYFITCSVEGPDAAKKAAAYDVEVEVDDPKKSPMASFVMSSQNQQVNIPYHYSMLGCFLSIQSLANSRLRLWLVVTRVCSNRSGCYTLSQVWWSTTVKSSLYVVVFWTCLKYKALVLLCTMWWLRAQVFPSISLFTRTWYFCFTGNSG